MILLKIDKVTAGITRKAFLGHEFTDSKIAVTLEGSRLSGCQRSKYLT